MTIQRYSESYYDAHEDDEGDFVRFEEYEKELAALREELANANHETARYANEAIRLTNELTAAEQRNAELTDVLTKAVEWFDDGVGRSEAEFDMLQKIRAALNPTESGASE